MTASRNHADSPEPSSPAAARPSAQPQPGAARAPAPFTFVDGVLTRRPAPERPGSRVG